VVVSVATVEIKVSSYNIRAIGGWIHCDLGNTADSVTVNYPADRDIAYDGLAGSRPRENHEYG
jgi:hypothetical protein